MEILDGNTAPIGFGGKGTSLAWLQQNGYRCPDFDLLDAGNWLAMVGSEDLTRAWRTVRHGEDQFAFSLACHELRRAVAESSFPEVIEEWLRSEPFARLGGVVAVRSSALSEDGASISSAGQYESVLGVTNEEQLRQAVREVLGSYFGERAVLYRRARGIEDSTRLAMGVVVQSLVDAEVCGIAFSCHPVTRRPGATIEASWGLGPPLVTGETDPDHFEFDEGGAVSVSIGRKQAELRFDAVAGGVQSGRRPESDQPCISTETASEIAATVAEMERRYECPVDVEWAIPSGRPGEVVYLQIRPVTEAGPPVPVKQLSTY